MANSIKLDQKRLEHLRQSLYGKQREVNTPHSTKKNLDQKNSSDSVKHTEKSVHHDTKSSALGTESYITRDLLKVAFLSTLLIFLQLVIHAALVNRWVTINFFGLTY